MGFFSKLMGGVIGFGVGGPIGAIVGVLLVSAFSGGVGSGEAGGNVAGRDETESRFVFSLLVLISAVLKADGVVKKSELPFVKAFLLQNFGEEKAKDALQVLKELLKQNVDVDGVSRQLGGMMQYSVKLELLNMLFGLAKADGELVDTELAMVKRISMGLGISMGDFNSIRTMMGEVKNEDWAYDVLELKRGATQDDIKKAYREMAKRYHPDKVGHLGEDVRRSSEEKFKMVQEAYESLSGVSR